MSQLIPPNKFTISDLYKGNSINQIGDVFDVTENIIDSLDEYALKELCEGYSYDVDKLFMDIVSESNSFINSGGSAQSATFNYLEHLTDSLDDYLKDLSFSYFVSNNLSDFNIETYHLEWMNMTQIYRFLCILAARGHSKSFCFSYAYPLWKMWKYKGKGKIGRELTLITAEEGLAYRFIDQIKKAIEENPILKDKLYPNQKGTWAKGSIQTRNEFVLVGKGIGSALRGLHTDVLCDDILDETNFYNSKVRKQTIEMFHSVITNIPLPKIGRISVVGTVFHDQDLYANLKQAKNWRVFEYPAIYPDGTLLSPERFTLQEILDKRESQGSISFSRELLMKPITNQTSLFPMNLIKAAYTDVISMPGNVYSCPIKFKKIGIGVDLAIAANTDESADSDYFVCAIIGIDDLNRYWILNIYRNKGLSYLQQVNVVKRLNEAFKPDVIMVESNQYQQAFAQMLRDGGLTNVVDRATTGKSKYDFHTGIVAVSVLFEQFRIKIPYQNDTYTRNNAEMIAMEFNSLTFNENKIQGVGAHDDIAMATWLGITSINYVNSDLILSFIN